MRVFSIHIFIVECMWKEMTYVQFEKIKNCKIYLDEISFFNTMSNIHKKPISFKITTGTNNIIINVLYRLIFSTITA